MYTFVLPGGPAQIEIKTPHPIGLSVDKIVWNFGGVEEYELPPGPLIPS